MSNRGYNNSGPIPNRWLRCPNRSDIIEDRFIGFKTPLDKKFDSQTGDASFYPNMLFDLVKSFYKVCINDK